MPTKARHIKIDSHLIRDVARDGLMKFEYVQTEANVADICTKVLGPTALDQWTSKLFQMENFVSKVGNVVFLDPFGFSLEELTRYLDSNGHLR